MKQAADRALQVAMEMERLGVTFYESLAAGCGNTRIAALATELAKSERGHLATFKRMLSGLPAADRGPLLTEKELYEAAVELRTQIMPGTAAVRDAVLASDLGKVMQMAIKMETDGVQYYTDLVSTLTSQEDSAIVTRIVDEEKNHLDALRKHCGAEGESV